MGVLGRSEERASAQNRVFVTCVSGAARDAVVFLAAIPTAFPFGRFKEPPHRLVKKFSRPPARPVLITKQFDDELCSPTAVSRLQVGPPTCRELAPRHSPLIFDREALRADAL